jgi:hypothetical protein
LGGVFNPVERFRIRQATDEDAKNFPHITDDEFANAMLGHICLPPHADREMLNRIWEAAYRAVLTGPAMGLQNLEDVDRLATEMWANVPLGKRLALYRNIALSLAAFAVAGALAPIDGGTTLITLAHYKIALSGVEILAIAVGGPLAGLLASMPSTHKLIRKLENEVAKPQVSQLYAGLMDGLGVPRYLSHDPELRRSRHSPITLTKVDSQRLPSEVDCLGRPWLAAESEEFARLTARIQEVDHES